MKVAVFHPGTQHSRQTALALQQIDRLAFLATGLFDHPGSRMRRAARLLPPMPRQLLERELGRHASPEIDPALVRTYGRYEWPERIAARVGVAGLARWLDTVGNARLGKRIAAMTRAGSPLALWGYDGSSFAAFADPRTADAPKILDRTIADWRFWNEEHDRIAETHGEWLEGGIPRWDESRIARDDIEYSFADRILCGSPFVAETIARYSRVAGVEAKLDVLPYTFDAALFGHASPPTARKSNEPLRLLFVGQISARKGVQHLLEAIARIPPAVASLTLVGPVMVRERLLTRYRDRVEIVGPVPRAEIPAIMQRHHALVFPSHFEGSAVVLPEAMASGLALIQTQAAGLGASKDSGTILESASADSVESAIIALARDHDLLHSMRLAAQVEAKSRDFDSYRRAIAALLESMHI